MTMMRAPRLLALMAEAAMLALGAGQVDAGGKAEGAKIEVRQSQTGGAAKADKKADRKVEKASNPAKLARMTRATLPEEDLPEIAIKVACCRFRGQRVK